MSRLRSSTTRRFLLLSLTQASFSGSSLIAAILISQQRSNPKEDLALLGGLTLGQGIVRLIVGLNLALEAQRSRGAGLLALALLAVAGLPFFTFGFQWWLAAAAPTVAYEICRITLTRSGRERQCLNVFVADLAWLTPFVAMTWVNSVPIGVVVGIGAALATTVMLAEPAARGMLLNSVQPGGIWWRERKAAIGRSAIESISGALVPFGCVAVLIAIDRLDDVNALRAAAQILSPQGSLVGVVILLWPQLTTRRRTVLSASLIIAPAIVPLLAALFPGMFAVLSADSPMAVTYALGWAAFGCSQTRVAFSNADRRLGLAPQWNMAGLLSACASLVLLLAALLSADDAVTQLAITTVCGLPWLVGVLLNRSHRPLTTQPDISDIGSI